MRRETVLQPKDCTIEAEPVERVFLPSPRTCYYSATMTAGPRLQPSTSVEEALWASSRRFVAGVDEVGRGPLAGPVFAAAVILDPECQAGWLNDLRDSKVLSAPERERLALAVREEALDFALGWASVAEIDGWGIASANRVAMVRALEALRQRPNFVLIDGPSLLSHPLPQRAIIDGDATVMSIAAASIVAKVARDNVMRNLDSVHPEYGFAAHKGYATREHLARLTEHGPSVQHRRSWLAVQRRAAESAALRGEVIPEYLRAPR